MYLLPLSQTDSRKQQYLNQTDIYVEEYLIHIKAAMYCSLPIIDIGR